MHRYKVIVNILNFDKTISSTDVYRAEAPNKSTCMSDAYWKYSYIPRQLLMIKVLKDK